MAIFWQYAGYVFVSIVPMCTFFQFFQLVFSFRIPIVFSKCLGKKFLPKHSFFLSYSNRFGFSHALSVFYLRLRFKIAIID